jgi:uncharacterized membrane protein
MSGEHLYHHCKGSDMTTTHSRVIEPKEAETLLYDPRQSNKVNVGSQERLLSTIGGLALVLYGLSRFNLRGFLLTLVGGELARRGITGHSFLYQTFDVTSIHESPHTLASLPNNQGVKIQRAMTIERPASDLYRFWRNVENAPLYMPYIDSVHITGEKTSHWRARIPAASPMEWDSEITEEVKNRLIAWHTTDKALTGNAGRVRFEPSSNGKETRVTLELDYYQFKGPLMTMLGKTFGYLPEQQVREDLRRFKELMETGEIPTIRQQPTGEGKKESLQI